MKNIKLHTAFKHLQPSGNFKIMGTCRGISFKRRHRLHFEFLVNPFIVFEKNQKQTIILHRFLDHNLYLQTFIMLHQLGKNQNTFHFNIALRF